MHCYFHLLRKVSLSVQSHSPAVTLKITNENGRIYSVDLTLAIKHWSWPKDAEEWRREHQHGICFICH